ncbi:MAG: glycosyltransferase [Spirochaetaceae bacterium]|nr:glycosyltransferase [Spirochaetaceae bacterium]
MNTACRKEIFVNMNSPLISFIIPFYNRFALLKEALASVLASSFKDAEIILVDDASDADGTGELLDFIRQFKNIVYIRQEKNLGPGAARNRGISAAKGEWIFFMDSDDTVYPDVLPRLARFLTGRDTVNSDFVILYKSAHKFPDGHIENVLYGSGTVDEYINNFVYIAYEERGELWNCCFRKIFLIQNSIKCPDTYIHEDWCFFLSAYCRANKISVFRQCFYEHHIENKSLSLLGHKSDSQFNKIADARSTLFHCLISLYESDIPGDKKYLIEYLLSKYILLSQWNPLLYQNNETVRRILDQLRLNIAGYTENWNKKIYIAPCFLEAAFTAELIAAWSENSVRGGGGIAGFIDADNSSERALACQKTSGLTAYKINEIDSFSGSIILLFGVHADEIAEGFKAYGLTEGRGYVKTGLL